MNCIFLKRHFPWQQVRIFALLLCGPLLNLSFDWLIDWLTDLITDEHCLTLSRYAFFSLVSLQAPRVMSRTNTWFSSFSDHSSSTDNHSSSFDSVDGLFSRNTPMALPYEPVKAHWYFCRQENNKDVWVPFTFYDSKALEEAYNRRTCLELLLILLHYLLDEWSIDRFIHWFIDRLID